MAVERYRIKDPTIVMFQDGQVDLARTISVGTIVEVLNAPLDGNNLVEVAWDGRKGRMFTQDLRSCAERVV